MAGTHSGFPDSLDILARLADGVNDLDAEYINVLADSARQLEVAIGVDPLNNFPVTSGYHALSTVGAWLPYLFRMEFGQFELSLPIDVSSTGVGSDFNVTYKYPLRFNKTATNSVPHMLLFSFDDPQESQGESAGGYIFSAVSRAPNAHCNIIHYGSTGLPTGVASGDVKGFTMRNNDTWAEELKYESKSINVRYWAFEPNYQA